MKKIFKYSAISLTVLLVIYLSLAIFLGTFLAGRWHAEVEGSQFLTFPEGEIRYTEKGDSESAILFLHGFNGQISNWNKVWKEMGNCYHAIRLDIPGFGSSVWNTESYTLQEQAKRVHQFIESKGLNRVVLVGTSMGGSLSATLAGMYPGLVKGVILMAPSAYPGSLKYRQPFTYLRRNFLFHKSALWVVKTPFYKWMFPKSIPLQGLTLQTSYDDTWIDSLRKIKAPTVILWSKGDELISYKYASIIAKEITHAKVMMVSDEAGHNIPGNEPAKVAQLACQFALNNL